MKHLVNAPVVGAFVLAVGALLAPVPVYAGTELPVIDAAAGPVRGLEADGVVQFRGIPYAAAPVGDLRWRPPVSLSPWTTVRDATAFGPACAHINTLGTFAGPPTNNEDCLSLNVFAPDDATPGARLPVIVWLHGGGNFTGSSDPYDGSGLVKTGRVIVVTVNWPAPFEVIHPLCWSADRNGWSHRWPGSVTSPKRSSPSCARSKC